MTIKATLNQHGVPEISPDELQKHLGSVHLIDVRRPDEFTGELGHIAGSKLVTLGPDLATELESCAKNETYIFICRSGQRSSQATGYALGKGFSKVYNLEGGMILWNEKKFPVER